MAPKKSSSACIFCLTSPYKNPKISLHSFPKNQSKRSLWLTACGLTEEDYKPSRKLCSKHFEQDCFKTGTHLNILKPNSVPTKLNKHSKEFFESTCFHKMAGMSTREVPELTYQIVKQNVSTEKFVTVSNCKMETSQIYDAPKQKPNKYNAGGITVPDLATSRKIALNFTKAKWKIIEQQKKIKYLNLKVSRLRKRLSSMAALMNDLRIIKSSN